MSNSRRAIGLVLRSPSLKGYSIEGRIPARQGTRVYQAVHRHSLVHRRVYVPFASITSIAGVIDVLERAGVEFQALRLRNGDVCLVAEAGPELISVPPGQALNGKHRKNFTLAFAVMVALAITILSLSLWSGEPAQRASTAQPAASSQASIASCRLLLDSSEVALVAYLEKGATSAVFEFEALTSLQNGGLRSVEAKVTCLPDIERAADPQASQKWRATLTKSQLSWRVTKMTRLEN